MIYNAKEYTRLRNAILCVSLIAWIIMLTEPRSSSCCALTLVTFIPPSSFAKDWALMLIAMMAPTLVGSVYYIWSNSFARRRLRSIALFTVGYGAVWMAAGYILFAVKLAGESRMPQSYFPAIVVALLAFVWQASPFKQRCLNRCHGHRSLSPFGLAADGDAARLGFEHGFWCTCSCWAAMLFPILLPAGHFVAMIGVSIVMFCERLDPPRTPSWRWRGLGTASRYLILRLRGAQCDPAPWASIGQA